MSYDVVRSEEVSVTDMGEMLDGMLDPHIRSIQSELGAEKMVPNLWYFEPGEEMPYHIHDTQEEVFYVLEGEFVAKMGEPEDPEVFELGPGDFYVAGPDVGHGHRYEGDDEGIILAIGAPAVTDINYDTWRSLEDI